MVTGTVVSTEPGNEEIKKKKKDFSFFLVNLGKSLLSLRSSLNIQILLIEKKSISKWSRYGLQAGLSCLVLKNLEVMFCC